MPTRPGHSRASRLSAARSNLPGRLVRDHRVRHALDADEARERAGVDAGEPDDAARLQPLVEVAGRAVVRRSADRGVQHDAARARGRRHVHGLDVVLVGADIADMREGEGDDLPGIGRIGEDLLVAGHGGVEADLAHRVAGGAEARSLRARCRRRAPAARSPSASSQASPEGVSAGCFSVIEGLNLGRRSRSRVRSTHGELRRNFAKGHSRAARRDQHRPQRRDESPRRAPGVDAAPGQCRAQERRHRGARAGQDRCCPTTISSACCRS